MVISHGISLVRTINSNVFIGYLGAHVADRVHILQFRSTHQYYRTAKYELDRATSFGDRSHWCFGRPIDNSTQLKETPTWAGPQRAWFDWLWVRNHTTYSISITSGAIKLILCSSIVLMSTSKLQNMNPIGRLSSEIPYENVLRFLVLAKLIQCDIPSCASLPNHEFRRNFGCLSSNGPSSELKKSWVGKRLLGYRI